MLPVVQLRFSVSNSGNTERRQFDLVNGHNFAHRTRQSAKQHSQSVDAWCKLHALLYIATGRTPEATRAAHRDSARRVSRV